MAIKLLNVQLDALNVQMVHVLSVVWDIIQLEIFVNHAVLKDLIVKLVLNHQDVIPAIRDFILALGHVYLALAIVLTVMVLLVHYVKMGFIHQEILVFNVMMDALNVLVVSVLNVTMVLR